MQIETDFLASAEVRTNINFDTIFNLRDSLKDAKKSKFEKSLKLAKMVSQSVQWFNASETKQLLEDNGIDWSNTEDLAPRFTSALPHFLKHACITKTCFHKKTSSLTRLRPHPQAFSKVAKAKCTWPPAHRCKTLEGLAFEYADTRPAT